MKKKTTRDQPLLILSCAVFSAAISFNCFSMAYDEFLKKATQTSIPITIAQYAIEAAKERQKSGTYYYIPTLGVNSLYKYDIKDSSTVDSAEVKATITSRLFSTDITDKIDVVNYTLDDADLLLQIEREKLTTQILKNLISIYYYKKLMKFAINLNKQSFDFKQRVKKQFENGAASENTINRTNLLVSRIENEINLINKQIQLFESNIETSTGISYPKEGIFFKDKDLEKVLTFKIAEDKLKNNLQYKNLMVKYLIAKSTAVQQDAWMTLDFSVENTWKHNERLKQIDDEAKVQLTANINAFNFNRIKEETAQLKEAESTKARMQLKMTEIKNNLKTFTLLQTSFIGEMSNLDLQIKQLDKLIYGHENEYIAGKVGLYEMLNTRFDLFTASKQKTDVEVQFAQNKVDIMQLTGSL